MARREARVRAARRRRRIGGRAPPTRGRVLSARDARPRARAGGREARTEAVHPSSRLGHWLETFSVKVTEATGTSWGFGAAVAVILAWGVTGPLFGFSDTWQLVINTGTTIVTFLMVFLIQRTQNKEAKALHLKLNELVAAIHGASNRLIDAESLSEDEIEILRRHYAEISRLAEKKGDLLESHSIDEAKQRTREKDQKQAEEESRLDGPRRGRARKPA